MNWIDILILIILAITIGMGFWRGFIYETLSLLAWIAAFIVARVFAPDVAQWLREFLESHALILLLSWVIPFLSTFLIFNLLKVLLISIISITGLRPIDRLLGAIFGTLKGVLLVTAAIILMQLVLSRSGEPFKTESKLVPHFQVIAMWMLETLDQKTELSFDSVLGKIGRMIDSGVNNINLDTLQDKLGMSKDEIVALLEDEQKLQELRNLINNPDILEQLKTSISTEECEKDNCTK